MITHLSTSSLHHKKVARTQFLGMFFVLTSLSIVALSFLVLNSNEDTRQQAAVYNGEPVIPTSIVVATNAPTKAPINPTATSVPNGCTTNDQCGTGYYCGPTANGNRCLSKITPTPVGGCTANDQCSTGYYCNGTQCVAKTNPTMTPVPNVSPVEYYRPRVTNIVVTATPVVSRTPTNNINQTILVPTTVPRNGSTLTQTTQTQGFSNTSGSTVVKAPSPTARVIPVVAVNVPVVTTKPNTTASRSQDIKEADQLIKDSSAGTHSTGVVTSVAQTVAALTTNGATNHAQTLDKPTTAHTVLNSAQPLQKEAVVGNTAVGAAGQIYANTRGSGSTTVNVVVAHDGIASAYAITVPPGTTQDQFNKIAADTLGNHNNAIADLPATVVNKLQNLDTSAHTTLKASDLTAGNNLVSCAFTQCVSETTAINSLAILNSAQVVVNLDASKPITLPNAQNLNISLTNNNTHIEVANTSSQNITNAIITQNTAVNHLQAVLPVNNSASTAVLIAPRTGSTTETMTSAIVTNITKNLGLQAANVTVHQDTGTSQAFLSTNATTATNVKELQLATNGQANVAAHIQEYDSASTLQSLVLSAAVPGLSSAANTSKNNALDVTVIHVSDVNNIPAGTTVDSTRNSVTMFVDPNGNSLLQSPDTNITNFLHQISANPDSIKP